MNKAELSRAVAEKADISKKDAAAAVDAVFAVIQDTLAAGGAVHIMGFGAFEVRQRAARQGRNPKTGEACEIAAGKAPAFKAGKSLKDAVAG